MLPKRAKGVILCPENPNFKHFKFAINGGFMTLSQFETPLAATTKSDGELIWIYAIDMVTLVTPVVRQADKLQDIACVKESLWESCVWKMVCDKVVCERWCVTKWCERWCVKDGGWQSGVWKPAQCHKCHAWHAKRRWMWPSDTPATWNEGGCHQVPRLPLGVTGDQARPSAPPSAISATPATQNKGRCHQVPRLPRKTKIDAAKCHACRPKHRGVTGDQTRHQVHNATLAMQNEGGCHQVPCLSRETMVDVAKCHSCHAKLSAVTGKPSAKRATRASPVPQVPRLPRKTKVDVTKGHTPAVQNEGGCHMLSPSATPAMPNQGRCRQVPRLPRKTKIDVAKCHACHAKRRFLSPSATHATQSWAASPATKRAQARHQSQPDAISATLATRNEDRCRPVPRLPRKTKEDVAKCHACHAKLSGVTSDQARPSAPKARHTVPPEPAQCHKCHACHAKRRWMWVWLAGGARLFVFTCLPTFVSQSGS